MSNGTGDDNGPPHSIEAEIALLGGLCIDPDRINEVTGILPSETAFYRLKHQHIFSAMRDLYKKDGTFEWESITDHVVATGNIKDCGSRSELYDYLSEVSQAPSGLGAQRFALIIMANYVKRRALQEGIEITEAARNPQLSTDEMLSRMWTAYNEVGKARGIRDRSTSLGESIDTAIADSDGGKLKGHYCGYGHLNNIVGGWAWGGLYIIGARPGKGKTGFMLNVADKEITREEDGEASGLWTSEMPHPQIAARMVCCRAGVSQTLFRRGNLNKENRAEIEHAREELNGGKSFRIDDRPGRNVYDLCNIFRSWNKQYGTRIFFVDYIQNMGKIPGVKEGYERIAETSQTLKQFALSTNAIVIAAAQLSRKAEDRKGRPIMSDLEGAGALEQDADGILMLHRLKGGSFDDDTANYEINVVKNRHGPTGRALFKFDKSLTRFREVTHHAE